MKYRLLTLLLFLFIAISCDDEGILTSTKNKSPKENSILSLSALPELGRVLDFIGFQSSSNARANADGLEINIDSILQILQADNIHHIYTFKIKTDSDSSFSNLVVEELETGHLAYILHYTYDSQFPVIPNFTGQISKFDLTQNLLGEITLNNGVFVSANESNANGKVLNMAQCLVGADVSTECEPTEGNSSATGLPLDFLGETCTTTITLYYGICENGGGSGSSNPGGGTYVPPDPCGSSGGSGSGSNPNPPTTPKKPKVGVLPTLMDDDEIQFLIDTWEEEQIDTSQLKPCMQAVVTDLKKLTQGSLGQIIQKFSGTVPGYNWEVKDGLLDGDNANTSPVYNRTTGTVTTIFDSNRFTNATDLSAARTILHEAVHAYLVVWRVTTLSFEELREGYPMLMDDYNDIKVPANEAQHNEMMRTFVNDIGIALREYGQSKGYNLSNQFYFDLAWGGLTHKPIREPGGTIIGREETAWFKALNPDPEVRKRIDDVISIEQSGKDSNGNTKNQNGNDTGC